MFWFFELEVVYLSALPGAEMIELSNVYFQWGRASFGWRWGTKGAIVCTQLPLLFWLKKFPIHAQFHITTCWFAHRSNQHVTFGGYLWRSIFGGTLGSSGAFP